MPQGTHYVVQVSDPPRQLPATTRHRWPEPDGPWLVTLAWAVVDGRPECVGLDVRQADGAGHLVLTTSILMRQLPIAEWIAADRAEMMPRPASTAGLRQSTVDRLTEAAEVYRAAVQDRRPPVKAVEAHFGLSKGGASNLITRARQVGLLPPTSPGVANAGQPPDRV